MKADEARNLIGKQWTEWKMLDPIWLDNINTKIYGVYIIRATSMIPRLEGESDILYIGQGILSERLRKILDFELDYKSWHYESGPICRIKRALGIPMEFSYTRLANKEQCELFEVKILDEYETQHFELPPINRSRGRNSTLPY